MKVLADDRPAGTRGYFVAVSCAHCGADLEHVNGARQSFAESLAVARCGKCGREYGIRVQMCEHRRTRP